MGVVELPHRGDLQPRPAGSAGQLLLDDEHGLRAGARHDAVEQVKRLGNRPCLQVLLERQRLLEKSVRVEQRVLALRDRELPELLPLRAVQMAVPPLHEREQTVRAPEALRSQVVAHRRCKAVEHRVVARYGEHVACQAEDGSGTAGPDRVRGMAQRHDTGGTSEDTLLAPAQAQAEVLAERDHVAGRVAERGERQAVELALLYPGPIEAGPGRLPEVPEQLVGFSLLVGARAVRDDDGLRHGQTTP